MKSYTDLEQSKKLAVFLPLESANMWYWEFPTAPSYNGYGYPMFHKGEGIRNVPCWSLTALLGLMPKIGAHEPMLRKLYYTSEPTERYICQYSLTDMTSEYDNPIDACYEMVVKLKEQNLI